MKKNIACDIILDLVIKEKNIQRNRLFKKFTNTKKHIVAKKTLESAIKYLENKDMIFKYSYNKHSFLEPAPQLIFYKNLTNHARRRIDEFIEILEQIENNFLNYGTSTLEYLLMGKNFNVDGMQQDIHRVKILSNSYEYISACQKKCLKIISKIETKQLMNNKKSLERIHKKCNNLQKSIVNLKNKREKMYKTPERDSLDVEMKKYNNEYLEHVSDFDKLVEKFKIDLYTECPDVFSVPQIRNHKINMPKKFIDKHEDENNISEISDHDKQILNLIDNYRYVSHRFVVNVLVNYEELMSESTFSDHVRYLIKSKKILTFSHGKRTRYVSTYSQLPSDSEKQIHIKCKKYHKIFLEIKHDFPTYDITLQRSILQQLNTHFKYFVEIIKSFKKFEEKEKLDNCRDDTLKIFEVMGSYAKIDKYKDRDFENVYQTVNKKCVDMCKTLSKIFHIFDYNIKRDLNFKQLLKDFLNDGESLKTLYENNIMFNIFPKNELFLTLFEYNEKMKNISQEHQNSELLESVLIQLHMIRKEMSKQDSPISQIQQAIFEKKCEIIKLKIRRNKNYLSDCKKLDEEVTSLKKALLMFYEQRPRFDKIKKLVSSYL